MKHFALLLFFIPFSLFLPTTSAQVFNDPAFKATVQSGLDLMYNMEYDQAEQVFEKITIEFPTHPAGPFMKGMNRWWQTYISVNTPTYYDFIEDQIEVALTKNKDLDGTPSLEQEQTFFSFMSYALLGRLHAYRKEYFAAIGSARKVISPLKSSLKYVGEQPEFYMVAGLYHYYVATYGDFYPIVRPLMYFFPDGDKDLGLIELQQAASTPSFTQVEAGFFLGYIYLDELPDLPKGLKITKQLFDKYPRNTWFESDYARGLMMNGQIAAGEKIIDHLIATYEAQAGHTTRNINSLESRYTTHLMIKVYHYKGFAMLFEYNDFAKALEYFETSNHMAELALVKEDVYLAGNSYYKGVCYDNLDQRGKAIQSYELTLDMNDNYYYKADAKKNLKEPHLME
ncbi:MAG: hypothetical protein AAF587_21520 [Bacteroidota bacterium]